MSAFSALLRLVADTTGFERPLTRAATHVEQFGNRTRAATNKAALGFADLKKMMFAFSAGAAAVAGAAIHITKASNAVFLMSQRLKIFSGDARAFEVAYAAATRARVGLEDLTSGMTRLIVVGKDYGVTAETSARMTETFLKAARLGGATAAEAAGSFIQLSQGLGEGNLRGQELRSILQGAPLIAKALAKELGTTTGHLRALGEQGKISAEVVIRALEKMGPEIDKQFALLPMLWEQSLAKMKNAWMVFLKDLDSVSGTATFTTRFAERAADALAAASERLEQLRPYALTAELAGVYTEIVKLQAVSKQGGPILEQLFGDSDKWLAEAERTIKELYGKAGRIRRELMGPSSGPQNARRGWIFDEPVMPDTGDLDKLREAGEKALASLQTPAEKIRAKFKETREALETLARVAPEHAEAVREALARLAAITQEELDETSYEWMLQRWQVETRTAVEKMSADWSVFKAHLDALFAAGVKGGGIDAKTYNARFSAGLKDVGGLEEYEVQSKRMRDSAKNHYDQMSEYAKEAARNIQDAFADFLFDPFDKGLKGMLKGFIDIMRRMLANQLASQILGGSFGTWFTGLFGGKKAAAGGPVAGGVPVLVGEKGPELYVPNTYGGSIVPNNKLGGMTLAPVYNIDARGATTDLVRALPGILQENNRRLMEAWNDRRLRGAFV